MSLSSRRWSNSGGAAGSVTLNFGVVRMIAILTLTVSGWSMIAAEDQFPTIQIPDAPTASSPTVSAPTASVPTPGVVAVPTPIDGGGGGGVTLDSPTITPSSVSAVAPTITITPPTPTTNTTVTPPTPAAVSVPSTVQPTTTTLEPTTTFFPTITAEPTITAVPTSAQCNICGNGTISSNDIIPFEIGNITCVEAVEFGLLGEISSSNCEVIQEILSDTNLCKCIKSNSTASDVPSPSPTLETFEPCNICGDGYFVAFEEGELILTEPISCGFASQGGLAGLLSPEVCDYLQNQTSPLSNSTNTNPCGCATGTMPPAPATCHVCGNVDERVTLFDAIVDIPEDVLDALPDTANASSSLFTCSFVEKEFNTTLDTVVCEFVQMVVADTCECQVPPSTTPPTPCNVCGNVDERVTLFEAMVDIPDDVLNALPAITNVSSDLLTCSFVEEAFKTTLNTSVCENVQMVVANACECQVPPSEVETGTPIPPPTLNPTSNNITNNTSFASIVQSNRWNALVAIFPLLYYVWF